ncbi:MAG TPA: hypothetical protein VI757_05280 [Bacteroidia bacterium]|nr:hypothetical protein [Bacteroidia bacterium]
MKTVIVSISEKKERVLNSFLKKNRIRSRMVSEEEMEDAALAKWIDAGMKTEDIPIQKVFDLLRKNGANR